MTDFLSAAISISSISLMYLFAQPFVIRDPSFIKLIKDKELGGLIFLLRLFRFKIPTDRQPGTNIVDQYSSSNIGALKCQLWSIIIFIILNGLNVVILLFKACM